MSDVDLTSKAVAYCPQCGAPSQGGQFCQDCGARFSATSECPKCGASIEGKVTFCPECGEKSGLLAGDATLLANYWPTWMRTILARKPTRRQSIWEIKFAR